MEDRRERRLAWGLFGLGVVVLWLTVGGLVGPVGILAALAYFVPALRVQVGSAERTTAELVGAATVGFGLFVVATFRPLAGLPLPDVGVLDPYTYLATEVAFGTLALVLLVRAGRHALRRAAATIAVIYPLAYVWDWYTLEVGVFAIPLRTGVEFVGIPLEEHLFMVVVPALILGVHETLHRRGRDT